MNKKWNEREWARGKPWDLEVEKHGRVCLWVFMSRGEGQPNSCRLDTNPPLQQQDLRHRLCIPPSPPDYTGISSLLLGFRHVYSSPFSVHWPSLFCHILSFTHTHKQDAASLILHLYSYSLSESGRNRRYHVLPLFPFCWDQTTWYQLDNSLIWQRWGGENERHDKFVVSLWGTAKPLKTLKVHFLHRLLIMSNGVLHERTIFYNCFVFVFVPFSQKKNKYFMSQDKSFSGALMLQDTF